MTPASVVINRITTPDLSFAEALDAYARHGCAGITPWMEDVADIGAARAARMARDAGLAIGGFCNCGLFIKHGRAGRAQALEAARRAVDTAAELGAPTIVTVVGGLGEGETDLASARAYAFDCLAETLEHARTTPVTLGLEPLHPMYTPDWSALNSLRMANDWCERLGDGIGVTIDSYHLWWDAEVSEQIARAGAASRIVSYHMSDWMAQTSDILWDRGFPGEGVIDLAGLTRQVRAAGYSGPVEFEVFSNRHRVRPADEALSDLLGRVAGAEFA